MILVMAVVVRLYIIIDAHNGAVVTKQEFRVGTILPAACYRSVVAFHAFQDSNSFGLRAVLAINFMMCSVAATIAKLVALRVTHILVIVRALAMSMPPLFQIKAVAVMVFTILVLKDVAMARRSITLRHSVVAVLAMAMWSHVPGKMHANC